MLPSTPTHSYSFGAHCHLFPLVLSHSHSFSAHSYSLPRMFTPFLLNLSPLLPVCSLSYPFPVHIQKTSPNPTHHLPFQPIFSSCVLRAYVLYVPVRICAFAFYMSMSLYNSFLFILRVSLLIHLDYIYNKIFSKFHFFFKMTVLNFHYVNVLLGNGFT